MVRPALSRHPSPVGTIAIRRKRNGAVTMAQRGGNQSMADRNGISLASYVHALYGLAAQVAPRAALMVGCGGGTLATMLHRAGIRVDVVDVDPGTFALARAHFGMPRVVRCHAADGLAFLQRTRRRFDVVVVDAFVGERIPEQFTSDAFFAAARRCLRADGALLVNVCLDGRRDRTADRLAAGLARAGWPVRILDERGTPQRNAVVLAGAVRGLRRPRLLVAPTVERDRIARELAAMGFRRRRMGALPGLARGARKR